jgi:hypothetical protein
MFLLKKQKITLIFATATVPTTINNLNCFFITMQFLRKTQDLNYIYPKKKKTQDYNTNQF